MANAKGPIFVAGGFQHVDVNGYNIQYLPDIANADLQREGKPPVYYWLPNEVRLARKQGDAGDYVFSFVHFAGVQNDNTHVGGGGDREVSGGVLSFSTTSALPAAVLKASEDKLCEAFRGNDDLYWGWRSQARPEFRPAPIVSNVTVVSSVSPQADGTLPAPVPTKGTRGLPMTIRGRTIVPQDAPKMVRMSRVRSGGMDPMFFQVQGQGPGSVSPFAQNAYSAICGSTASAVLWSSFHGGTGLITVHQALKLRVVSPVLHIKIEGDWEAVHKHFSVAARASGFFWAADIQAQFNELRANGTIHVTTQVDTSLPGWEKIKEQIDKKSDLISQKFMEQAQKTIFDVAPLNEKPAEAPSHSGVFGGLGVAMKLRQDRRSLKLDYEETQQFAYIQDYRVSGVLTGLADEIKANPEAEKKYFTTLYLSDIDRKVSRVIKPVVNWPDAAKSWVGEPVAFLSAQIGYPNGEGVLQWDGHIFTPQDPPDAHFNTATEMKRLSDVKNPPPGWKPDITFVKRKIHFLEPKNDTENPFVRVSIEKNEVDLDPEEFGTPTSDINIEVRADSVGCLQVGPISLGVELEGSKQVVEVEMRALGKKADGTDREPVRFSFNATNQNEPRYWMLFTGQPTFKPEFEYRVRVVVKGSLFTKGMEWIGPWETAAGSGPLIISVPAQENAVHTRSIPLLPTPPQPAAVAAPSKPAPSKPAPPKVVSSGVRPTAAPPPVTATNRAVDGGSIRNFSTTVPGENGRSRAIGDPPLDNPWSRYSLDPNGN